MSEKKAPPEIEHGPPIDRGVRPATLIPCSKRLQDGTRYGYCLKREGHTDECAGNLSEPYDTTRPLTRVVHMPKPKQ